MNALKVCKELLSHLEECLEAAKQIRDELKSHDPLDVNHIGAAISVVKLRVQFLSKQATAAAEAKPKMKTEAKAEEPEVKVETKAQAKAEEPKAEEAKTT